MSTRNIWRGVALAVVALAFAAAIGFEAYNLGVADGLTQTGQVVAGQAAGAAQFHGWQHSGPHAHIFFPILGFLFLLFLVKALFWRRHWHGYGYGHEHGRCHHHHDGVPPMFEEWHRRAHEKQNPPQSPGNIQAER